MYSGKSGKRGCMGAAVLATARLETAAVKGDMFSPFVSFLPFPLSHNGVTKHIKQPTVKPEACLMSV